MTNNNNVWATCRKPRSILEWGSVCFMLLFLLPAAQLVAQKIGYVSTETIRSKYVPAMQAEDRLKQTVEGWRTELDQFRRDIEDLELEMKKNRLIWGDTEREQKQRELEDKKRQRDKFARDKFEPGGEYDRMAEELYKDIWEKINLGIQKVAATESYDIVWDKSANPLVYVNAKYDLTVRVMQELGIDADELERKQKEVIDADPRNQKQQEVRTRRSRRRSTSREAEPTQSPDEPAPPAVGDGTPTNLPPVVRPMETPVKLPSDTTSSPPPEIPR